MLLINKWIHYTTSAFELHSQSFHNACKKMHKDLMFRITKKVWQPLPLSAQKQVTGLAEIPLRCFTSHPKGFFGSNLTNSTKGKVDKDPVCSYTSLKNKRKDNYSLDREEDNNKHRNIAIPYIASSSERILRKHHVPVQFKPGNTLRQKHFHSKDKTLRLDSAVCCIECSEDCTDLHIGETRQPLHRHLAQHRRASSSGQDSAVHLHLKDRGGRSFKDSNLYIWDRDDSSREEKKKPFLSTWKNQQQRRGTMTQSFHHLQHSSQNNAQGHQHSFILRAS